MFDLFMSLFMFLSIFNISHHNGSSSSDQKSNVWLIYVCIYFLGILNISLQDGISSFDQKANVWLIYVVFMF